ncbi:MAG: hypothetical protein NTY35_07350 [Planctomycetota bacterium]|nr:hypothetical protein [Planctomycetota bacterium]
MPLSPSERRTLRASGIRLAEIAPLGAAGFFRRMEGALSRDRCAEIAALADFQRLGSIGLESARDFVRLGLHRVEDLVGREPIELYDELCRLTKARHDPCVEDVMRCAIAQAEDPRLPPDLRDWWRWSCVRGQPRGTRPARVKASAKGASRHRRP